MTELFANSLANVSTLHTLDLSFNNLTDVPGELFGLAHDWRVLDFTHNNLTDVPPMIATANVSGYMYVHQRVLALERATDVLASDSGATNRRLTT